jgi:glycerol-3-phosphate dehydrogenase
MKNDTYDMIIIGAGATGSGIAVDAASRGFKTLLLEKNDFSEGTSSRSTKLVHGGVRYLEAAVKGLNKEQYNLVKEGLKERSRLLKNAPHLCSRLTLVTPIYKWWELPYMFIGLSLYDLVSGKRGLGRSSIVSKHLMTKNFPNIKKEALVGGVKYYDGTFNDARLNIALVQTAQKYGAHCKNYHEVESFVYSHGKIEGVKVKDRISNKEHTFYAGTIINATGAFSDEVRTLDESGAKKMLDLSSGIHIVLDKKYLPSNEGLMIPKTEDGRILFILPWMGKCLVGTTDETTKLSEHPTVEDKDIEYILKHLQLYFQLKIDKKEILSSWCGIRPLVAAEENASTSSIVREHIIQSSNSGLISIIGGKWTTYRKMAQECVDYAITHNALEKRLCQTKKLVLVGSEQLLDVSNENVLDQELFDYLFGLYGNKVDDIINSVPSIKRLHPQYCITNAELVYGIAHEFVKKPLDFLVRRTTLALIDINGAKQMLDSVIDIMKEELQWDETRTQEERTEAQLLLENSI